MKLNELLIIGTCLSLHSCTPQEIFIAEEAIHETEVAIEAVEADMIHYGESHGSTVNAEKPKDDKPLDAGVVPAGPIRDWRKAAEHAKHEPKVLRCCLYNNDKKAKRECTKHGC